MPFCTPRTHLLRVPVVLWTPSTSSLRKAPLLLFQQNEAQCQTLLWLAGWLSSPCNSPTLFCSPLNNALSALATSCPSVNPKILKPNRGQYGEGWHWVPQAAHSKCSRASVVAIGVWHQHLSVELQT